MSDWPPDGHTNPQEFKISEIPGLLIGALIGAILFLFLVPSLQGLAIPGLWMSDTLMPQVQNSWLAFVAYILVILIAMSVLLVFPIVIVVHEGIHYGVDLLLGFEPRFYFSDSILLKNPAVIALGDGITRFENILSLSAPFIVIGLISLTGLLLTEGFIGSIAAVVFLFNSGFSGMDIYTIYRITRLPSGTEFANFEQDEGYRTEIVVPENID